MSFELIPRNPKAKPVHINASIWSAIELAGMDPHKEFFTASEAEEMANSLDFIVRLIEFFKKSGGFRIEYLKVKVK